MTKTIIIFLALGLAAGMISLTISKSKFFEPFRDFIFHRSNATTRVGKIFDFVYELVSCSYCLSHWVSIAMVAIWQPRITDCGFLLVDLGVSVFVIVGLASYAWGIVLKLAPDHSDEDG